jgi:serine/threonine-protein kinase
MIWVNRDGTIGEVVGEPVRGLRDIALSPDETRVAYVADDGDAGEIWVYDLERDTRTRLTFTPENEATPVWIPGKNSVAFTSVTDSGQVILSRAADGSGETELVVAGGSDAAYSRDGRFLAYQQTEGVVGDLVIMDLSGSREPVVFLSGGTGSYSPGFSPDGRFLFYQSWEAGTASSYIRPADGSPGKWEIPESWESYQIWLENEMLFTSYKDEDVLYRMPVEEGAGLTLGTPVKLMDLEPLGFDSNRFAVTADGQRILMMRSIDTGELEGGIVVVENWAEEFTRKTDPPK